MKAWQFAQHGPPSVLQRVEKPLPKPGSGQLLVRVEATGLNPIDNHIRSGRYGILVLGRLPFVGGTDLAGTVEAVGPGVTRFVPGDAVMGFLPEIRGGGFAQFALIHQNQVCLRPANLNVLTAAAAPLCALTALQALRKRPLQPGEDLLVVGAAGGVGHLAVQLAHHLGARVTALDAARHADTLLRLGAHEVLDYRTEDPCQRERKYDLVLDLVGQGWDHWRPVMKENGSYITTIIMPGPLLRMLAKGLFSRQQAAVVSVRNRKADLEELRSWLATGKLQVVVDRVWPAHQLPQALEALQQGGHLGKLVADWQAPWPPDADTTADGDTVGETVAETSKAPIPPADA